MQEKSLTVLGRQSNLRPIMAVVNITNPDQMMAISVQVDKAEVIVYTTVWMVSLENFLSNIGGGLGLCLGFSIISSLYYLFDKCDQKMFHRTIKV